MKLERWVPLIKLSDQYAAVLKRHSKAQDLDQFAQMSAADQAFMIDYQCFVQTLDLFAETCLHRNKEN